MPFEYRPKTRRFEVPLPADTDHTFKIDIISSGEVGYKLTTSDFPLYDRELQQIDSIETTVAGRVDNAAISLDSDRRLGIRQATMIDEQGTTDQFPNEILSVLTKVIGPVEGLEPPLQIAP